MSSAASSKKRKSAPSSSSSSKAKAKTPRASGIASPSASARAAADKLDNERDRILAIARRAHVDRVEELLEELLDVDDNVRLAARHWPANERLHCLMCHQPFASYENNEYACSPKHVFDARQCVRKGGFEEHACLRCGVRRRRHALTHDETYLPVKGKTEADETCYFGRHLDDAWESTFEVPPPPGGVDWPAVVKQVKCKVCAKELAERAGAGAGSAGASASSGAAAARRKAIAITKRK